MKDKMLRSETRWVKVSGYKGRYTVALGWTGELKANKIQHWRSMAGALIAAQNWIDGQ